MVAQPVRDPDSHGAVGAMPMLDGLAQGGFARGGPVRLGTLVLVRWIGIVGQAITLIVVHFGLGFPLPIGAALMVVGASAVLNIAIMPRQRAGARLSEKSAAWFLGFDIVQLSVLLFLTGGLANPFALLLLAPLTVSATILGLGSMVTLGALALGCIAILANWHMPLPWGDAGLSLPFTYILGIWVALTLGIVFAAAYAWRVAEEARRMSNALAAMQLALAREHQISALGALAAAAAHELGTPLGTIAVAAREITRELPPDSPIQEDAQLLLEQAARCRDILADLARQRLGDPDGGFERLPLAALVETAAAPHLDDRVEIHIDAAPAGDGAQTGPEIRPSPEILHGLGNLLQNAIQFARVAVDVEVRWSDTEITVTINDDGPGFPPGALERLGEPYFSVRGRRDGHMGLGVFIARNLLERTGARLSFANSPGRTGPSGAEVTVRWQRPMALERPEQPKGQRPEQWTGQRTVPPVA